MAFDMGSTMQVLRPVANILAFYDGRIAGIRAHSQEPNWLDDGAFTLGCCSYAVVDGEEALVYDTHMSIPHARIIRRTLEDMGIRRIRVLLSHWHTDHVAGNAIFSDCEIIANRLTAMAMTAERENLEGNDPPIKPLIMPTRLFDDRLDLTVGEIAVSARHFDIHSDDGTVLLLPQSGLLLAGDTLEDTVTYVVQPERLAIHLRELTRLESLDFTRILPNHGSLERIAKNGYGRGLIEATRLYVEALRQLTPRPDLPALSLRDFAAAALATGGVDYFDAYEPVHRHNVQAVLGLAPSPQST